MVTSGWHFCLCERLCNFPLKVCLMSQWLTSLRVPPSAVSALCATVSSEVGRAVWLRFSPPLPSSGPQPSFMAHLSGAVVGISMGLLILRSYEESLQKQCSWWVIVFSFITFLLFAIFWNIFAYELLGVQIPPPPWWRPHPHPACRFYPDPNQRSPMTSSNLDKNEIRNHLIEITI